MFVIFLLYYVILNLGALSFIQLFTFLVLVSIIILNIFLVESYQFYYVLGSFKEFGWVYNVEEQLWGLELESSRLRLKHQYLLMCLIAKY